MSWRAVVLVAVASCAGACEWTASSIGSRASEVGEPRDGFSTWEERVILVWTNRARAAPADDLASCTGCADRECYSPQPPLTWQHELARVARLHSEMTARGGCNLQHNSPCTLMSDIAARFTPGSCDGDPSCACVPGTFACGSPGTPMADRLGAFGFTSGVRSENITGPYSDPVRSFYQWLHEPDSSSTCEFRYANGHRRNILSASYTGIGVGKASTGNVWTQDFTSSTPRGSGVIAGVHYPRTGATVELRANWYGSAPIGAEVNVEGACRPMTLERGADTNGTYLASASGLGAGCYRYTFRFASSEGEQTLPSTGSYGIGCAEDWVSSAPPPCGAAIDPDAGAADAGVAPTDAGKRGRGRGHGLRGPRPR